MTPILTLAGLFVLVKRVAVPLARAFYLIAVATLIHLPLAVIRLAAGVHLRRVDPPPPFRGHHPATGVPLRTFQDSLQDLRS